MVLYYLALSVHSTIVSLYSVLYYLCNKLRLNTLSWFYTTLHSLCILSQFLQTLSYTICAIFHDLLLFPGFILPCTLCAFYHSFFIQCLVLFVQCSTTCYTFMVLYYLVLSVHSTIVSLYSVLYYLCNKLRLDTLSWFYTTLHSLCILSQFLQTLSYTICAIFHDLLLFPGFILPCTLCALYHSFFIQCLVLFVQCSTTCYTFMVLYYLVLSVHSTIVSLYSVLYYLCNILRQATLSWFYTTLNSLCILPQFLYIVSYTICAIFYDQLLFYGFILPCILCAFYHSFFIQCHIQFVQYSTTSYSFMVLYYLALSVHSTIVSLYSVLYYLCNILRLATLSWFYTTLHSLCILPQFLQTLSYTICAINYDLLHFHGFILPCTLCAFYHSFFIQCLILFVQYSTTCYTFMVLYYLALSVHSTIVSLDIVLYYLCNKLRLATLSWFYTTLHSLCILPQFLYTVSYTICAIFYDLLHFHGFILPCTLCAFYHSFFRHCLILFVQYYTTCYTFMVLYYLALSVHSTIVSLYSVLY